MPNVAEQPQPAVEAFDEKQFYLDEFRGRTLLFSIPVRSWSATATTSAWPPWRASCSPTTRA